MSGHSGPCYEMAAVSHYHNNIALKTVLFAHDLSPLWGILSVLFSPNTTNVYNVNIFLRGDIKFEF